MTPDIDQQRKQLTKKLHAMARDRVPKARVHVALHDSAEMMFGVGSLTECTIAQLRKIEAELLRMRLLTSKTVRERSGRPKRDGVTLMITPRQRSFIRALASELGWSRSLLTSFLQTHFSVDSIDGLATSKTASQAINMLIGFKRKKQSKDRNARYAFG